MNPEDLKPLSLLVEFDEQDREALLELLDLYSIEAGTTLFEQGDEADSLLWIASGSVRIKSEAQGELGLVCEGGSLGAVSLMVIGTRRASATAEGSCRILELSRASFRRLADDFPRTGCRLAEAVVGLLAEQLRTNLERICAGHSR